MEVLRLTRMFATCAGLGFGAMEAFFQVTPQPAEQGKRPHDVLNL